MTLTLDRGLCACCGFFAFRRASAPRPRSSFACEAPSTTALKVATPSPLGETGRLVIVGATVVDPRTGEARGGLNVTMGQGRILSVSRDRPSADGEVIDARGGYVVPGYNDMHSHVLELENPSGSLALMLAEGVTGFRQMSGSDEMLAQRRSGTFNLPEAAPAALQVPGEVLTPLNAATPQAARAEVRQQKEGGADFIKVGLLSPEAFRAALDEARNADIAILGHLQDGVDAAEASDLGFRSVEHLGPGAPMWLACSVFEDGLKSAIPPPRVRALPKGVPFLRRLVLRRLQLILINPAAFASEASVARLGRASATFDGGKFRDLAARFVEEEVWHVPTLVRLRTQQLADQPEYRDAAFLKYMPKAAIRRLRKVNRRFASLSTEAREIYRALYPRQLRLAKAMAEAGVRMLAGTDGGLLAAPGLTLREEFAEFAKAGFTPLEVLQMATCNAADYLGRAATMGAVEPGMDADLLILSENPLARVENLHAITTVVRSGRRYDQSDLDALKAQVARRRGRLN